MPVTIKTPGGEVSYKVPVIKMEYSIDEIFEKKLLFLIPFYIYIYLFMKKNFLKWKTAL